MLLSLALILYSFVFDTHDPKAGESGSKPVRHLECSMHFVTASRYSVLSIERTR